MSICLYLNVNGTPRGLPNSRACLLLTYLCRILFLIYFGISKKNLHKRAFLQANLPAIKTASHLYHLGP